MKHEFRFKKYRDEEREEAHLRDRERNTARKVKSEFFREQEQKNFYVKPRRQV